MKTICPILKINYLTFCFARQIVLNDHLKLAKCNFFNSLHTDFPAQSTNQLPVRSLIQPFFFQGAERPETKHVKVWVGQTLCTYLHNVHMKQRANSLAKPPPFLLQENIAVKPHGCSDASKFPADGDSK